MVTVAGGRAWARCVSRAGSGRCLPAPHRAVASCQRNPHRSPARRLRPGGAGCAAGLVGCGAANAGTCPASACRKSPLPILSSPPRNPTCPASGGGIAGPGSSANDAPMPGWMNAAHLPLAPWQAGLQRHLRFDHAQCQCHSGAIAVAQQFGEAARLVIRTATASYSHSR